MVGYLNTVYLANISFSFQHSEAEMPSGLELWDDRPFAVPQNPDTNGALGPP